MFPPLAFPFVTETDYVQWSGAGQDILFQATLVAGGPPVVIPEADAGFYGQAPLSYDFPAVTLTTLRDVIVRGKSNILTAPEGIIRHGLIGHGTDVTPDEMYRRLMITADGRAATWAQTDRFNVGYLPEAAIFTDWTAFNYAHWLTEVLPRITAFVHARGDAPIPFLIDSELHPNIVRSLHLVAGEEVTLHRLAPDHLVRVGVAHNVSPVGYVPFKLREQPVETIPQGVFHPGGLRAMVEALRASAPLTGTDRPKLLIRRQSSMRHIANEPEIAEVLEARGFVPVRPEGLSLPEQIALYSRAKMIVGATGAGFANLVFSPPDCAAVVLMPRFRHTAYWYWRRMAAASGAGPVVHVSGEQIDPIEDPYHPLALHRDFRVELKDVLTAVETAEALVR